MKKIFITVNTLPHSYLDLMIKSNQLDAPIHLENKEVELKYKDPKSTPLKEKIINSL